MSGKSFCCPATASASSSASRSRSCNFADSPGLGDWMRAFTHERVLSSLRQPRSDHSGSHSSAASAHLLNSREQGIATACAECVWGICHELMLCSDDARGVWSGLACQLSCTPALRRISGANVCVLEVPTLPVTNGAASLHITSQRTLHSYSQQQTYEPPKKTLSGVLEMHHLTKA